MSFRALGRASYHLYFYIVFGLNGARDYHGLNDEPIETVDPGLNVCRAVNEA